MACQSWTLRACQKLTRPSCISDAGHLWPHLNRTILDVALLRLRLCSIGATKYGPHLSAILAMLFFDRPLVCPLCRYYTYVGAGTIFDKTRTPLTTWFEAAWHVSTAKNGLSAKTLERTIGTKYRVSWTMLQRFRMAMVDAERKQLSGNVEVDETFIGGSKQGGKRGRGAVKSIVVIAIEIMGPKGFGRVRMRHIPDASGACLIPFVCDVAAPGSLVHTDGWAGYNELSEHGYTRKVTILSSSGDPAHVSMPGVHRISSLLKRWILGTHQGAVVPEHLQSYLEEFTFRFNRRTSGSRGLVFRRLLERAVATNPITERDVTHGYNWS